MHTGMTKIKVSEGIEKKSMIIFAVYGMALLYIKCIAEVFKGWLAYDGFYRGPHCSSSAQKKLHA
jgi:hypothetical protein